MRYLFALIPVFLFNSCNSGENGSSLLPAARGADGEIIIVISQKLWDSELGEEIKRYTNPHFKWPRIYLY